MNFMCIHITCLWCGLRGIIASVCDVLCEKKIGNYTGQPTCSGIVESSEQSRAKGLEGGSGGGIGDYSNA